MACACIVSAAPGQRRQAVERFRVSNWFVVRYRQSRSAFNGYRITTSASSSVVCHRCGRCWRTSSKYVESLKILNNEEQREWARTSKLPH